VVHLPQSGPDSGSGFQAKVFFLVQVVPFLRGNGLLTLLRMICAEPETIPHIPFAALPLRQTSREERLNAHVEPLSTKVTVARAFAVKVEGKRLPVSPFSRLLKGCKGHETRRFEHGGTNQIRKTGKREVVSLQPLPQTLYLLR